MKSVKTVFEGAGKVGTSKAFVGAASDATSNKSIRDLVKKTAGKVDDVGDAAKRAAGKVDDVGDAAKKAAGKADDAAKAAKRAKKAKRLKKIKKTAKYGVAAGLVATGFNEYLASDVNAEARAECERACQPVMGTRPVDDGAADPEEGESDAAAGKPFNLCGADALAYPYLDDFVQREGVHKEGDDDDGTPVAELAPDDPKRVAVLEDLKCVSCAEGHRPTDEDFMYETYEGDALALKDYCTPVCADKCLAAYPVENVGPVEKAIAAVEDLFERLWNFDIMDAVYMVLWALAAVVSLRVGANYGYTGRFVGIAVTGLAVSKFYSLWVD